MRRLEVNEELTQQAVNSYQRAGEILQPEVGSELLEDQDGRRFVVLSDMNGALAAWRVAKDGRLCRLPAGLIPKLSQEGR
jgi:hypothetical protein